MSSRQFIRRLASPSSHPFVSRCRDPEAAIPGGGGTPAPAHTRSPPAPARVRGCARSLLQSRAPVVPLRAAAPPWGPRGRSAGQFDQFVPLGPWLCTKTCTTCVLRTERRRSAPSRPRSMETPPTDVASFGASARDCGHATPTGRTVQKTGGCETHAVEHADGSTGPPSKGRGACPKFLGTLLATVTAAPVALAVPGVHGIASSPKTLGRVLVYLAMLSAASGWKLPSQDGPQDEPQDSPSHPRRELNPLSYNTKAYGSTKCGAGTELTVTECQAYGDAAAGLSYSRAFASESYPSGCWKVSSSSVYFNPTVHDGTSSFAAPICKPVGSNKNCSSDWSACPPPPVLPSPCVTLPLPFLPAAILKSVRTTLSATVQLLAPPLVAVLVPATMVSPVLVPHPVAIAATVFLAETATTTAMNMKH